MKFNDLVNLLLEAERDKEPKSNVWLPDGTWRRVNSDGDVFYSKTNNSVNYHRTDGPAVEYADGGKEWWVNGDRHHLDGPAIEWIDGSNLWYVNGKLHRSDGPAVEYADGSKQWWVNSHLHRLDGPAVEWLDGSKQWWVNGKHHRLDGPAIEWSDGGKQWYVDNNEYSEEDFNAIFGVSKDPAILKQRAASNDLFESKGIHWEFDQSKDSEWRVLGRQGRYKDAIKSIEQFVKQNGWGNPNESVLMFHLFQMYAMDEQRDKAKQLLQDVINKGIWDDSYTRGTLAWYNNDEEALKKELRQAINDEKHRAASPENGNINILRSMLKGLGKTYKEVY